MPEKFDMQPCECCKGGAGLCLFAMCCPCFAYKEAADNITPAGAGGSTGCLYCVLTCPLGFGCCALTVLGDEVAQKRGIENGGVMCSCLKATFDGWCCYSCSVLHESRLYKEQMAAAAAGGGGAVQATSPMQRK